MSYRSSLPIMLMSMVGLVAVGLMATCGANEAAADSGDRLGCGTFCQSAGGFGATANSDKPSVTIVSGGTITTDGDGYAPVIVTCDLTAQCSGALVFCLSDPAAEAALGYGMAETCGRSDLLVNGGATRTIGVPLSPQEFASLKSNGPTTLYLNIDAGQAPGTRGTQCGDWNLGCKYQANGGAPSGFSLVTSDKLTVAAPG